MDASGKITAISNGTATITATAKDGSGKKATCKVTVVTKAMGITLNKNRDSIERGTELQLGATVYPDYTSNKTVTWKSSDERVATVDAKGKVFGVSNGEAVITAKTTDGSNKEARCYVTVKTKSQGVVLNEVQLVMNPGQKFQLIATVLPEESNDKEIVWSSTNEKVAKVDLTGRVIAIANGNATITAKTADGTNWEEKCQVTVTTPVSNLKLEKEWYGIPNGTKQELKVTILPKTASNKNVSWSSSNPKIVRVSDKGIIRGLKTGTATITCKALDGSGKKTTCRVTVYTNTEAFCARIYEKALQRDAEEEGLKYWAAQINTKKRNPVEVAELFFFAPEFLQKKWNNEEFVKILYRTFMGREYDQKGLDYWIARLEKGESRKSVLEAFAGCPEFQNIIKSFGL